jgi:hypothetical protein
MSLSVTPVPYIIPSYSLTGDLLSYLKCGLQYRYQNKGSLPPSKPVQLWFGEFIHGVMEEAYLRWSNGNAPASFPWQWQPTVREIELAIAQRLSARGLYAPPNVFDRDPASQAPLLASRRAESAINTWAQHLFPVIAEAEVRLKGIRQMPAIPNVPLRADYYEVQGIVDVLGSVQFANAPRGNLILHYLQNSRDVLEVIAGFPVSGTGASTYEIIVDYKGMRRPAATKPEWNHFQWQVLTYSWLRAQQPNSAPVIAAILLFINELVPSESDIEELQDDVRQNRTDVLPVGPDLTALNAWTGGPVPNFSRPFLEQRSFRVVLVDTGQVTASLGNFDDVVRNIEESVANEVAGQTIKTSWRAVPDRRTCTACDFKTYCDYSAQPGPPFAP